MTSSSEGTEKRCGCGYPGPRLPDGPYMGEQVAQIGDHGLFRLTGHERIHARQDLFCLRGLTHWLPIDQFRRIANQKQQEAELLLAATGWLAEQDSDPRETARG